MRSFLNDLATRLQVAVAISAPAQHYDAWATPVKYKLAVQANNATLDPYLVVDGATNFWVGQHLNFTAGFIPSLSEAPEVNAAKWVFDGNYRNDASNAVPGLTFPICSINYFVNPDKLVNPLTTAWWVAGNDSTNLVSQLKADFGEGLTFANGQYVMMTSKGLFNMIRPQVKVTMVTGIVQITNNLITYGTANAPGITFTSTQMAGSPGVIQWVQVINSTTASELVNGQTIGRWVTNVLDTTYPYNSDADELNTNSVADWPGMDLSGAQNATRSGNFNMWLEFQPNAGTAVPLRVVNWTYSGIATLSGASWILTNSSNNTNPPDADTVAFPTWTNNVDNFEMLPQ